MTDGPDTANSDFHQTFFWKFLADNSRNMETNARQQKEFQTRLSRKIQSDAHHLSP
jgi:hypothetical protein